MSSRFGEIAEELGKLQYTIRQLEYARWQLEQDINVRQIEITPDKWTGSNDSERKIARDRAYINDEKLAAINGKMAKIMQDIAKASGEIEKLQAERRGEEWDIRGRMADALMSRGIQPQHTVNNADIAFDDIADHETLSDLDSYMQAFYIGDDNPYPYPGDINPEFPALERPLSYDRPDLDEDIPF